MKFCIINLKGCDNVQNFMKTILSGVQTWTKGKIKESTADWNQNDSNADNYVKNRTHWEESKIATLVNNLTYERYNNGDIPRCTFIVGEKYDVIWNGVLYPELVCQFSDEWRVLGNSEELPFYIDDDGGNALYVDGQDGSDWTLSIYQEEEIIHKLDSKYLPDEVSMQADWDQYDPNAADYVKNRTHWEEEIKEFCFLQEQQINDFQEDNSYGHDGWYYTSGPIFFESEGWKIGKTYTIIFDGVKYEDTLRGVENGICFGKEIPYFLDGPDLPFGIWIGWDNLNSPRYVSANSPGPHTIAIYGPNIVVHTLDEKYLPDTIKTAVSQVSTKMNLSDPKGTGSLSINRYYAYTIGDDSNAVGQGTVANHLSETAFGQYNKFSDTNWELYEISSGSMQKSSSTAAVYSSSFEISTVDGGTFSLVNPIFTTVNKIPVNSYFKIGSNTNLGSSIQLLTDNIRNSSTQTTLKYITYESRALTDQPGEYLYSIGNGTSNKARSNAHTLDWEGNAWFAGDVYVGSDSGTNRDEGSKKLITLDDITDLTGKVLFDDIITFKYSENDRYYDFDTNLDLKENHLYKLIWDDAEIEMIAWFNDTDVSPCLDIEDKEYGTVYVLPDYVQLGAYRGQVPSVSRKLTIIDLEENVQEIKEELIPSYLARIDDIPEVESQVFIVTHNSVNDYDDLAEAIYNANAAGKVVIYQDGDRIYHLSYAELEPAHFADFSRFENNSIETITIYGSTITEKLFDINDYTDNTIANLVNAAPETLDTLGELATALQNNAEVINVLNEAITNKVDKSEIEGLATEEYVNNSVQLVIETAEEKLNEVIEVIGGNIEAEFNYHNNVGHEDIRQSINDITTSIDNLKQGLTLTDTVTGVNYLITVTNGKLTMQEV